MVGARYNRLYSTSHVFKYFAGEYMILKEKGRILGLDDGPFSRSSNKYAPFVGVLMRIDGRIEGIRIRKLHIDGDEAEETIAEMVRSIGTDNINLIMSEGITFAGFDIVSPEEIHVKTGIPYISITRSTADLDSMEAALSKHGEEGKIARLKKLNPVKCTIKATEFTVNYAGITKEEAMKILDKSTYVGNVPEPVRIAHMIAEGLHSYQSQ